MIPAIYETLCVLQGPNRTLASGHTRSWDIYERILEHFHWRKVQLYKATSVTSNKKKHIKRIRAHKLISRGNELTRVITQASEQVKYLCKPSCSSHREYSYKMARLCKTSREVRMRTSSILDKQHLEIPQSLERLNCCCKAVSRFKCRFFWPPGLDCTSH